MLKNDLHYDYPIELIATEPKHPSRILFVPKSCENPIEISKQSLIEKFTAKDVLVINETKVLPRRVFAQSADGESVEVLFLDSTDETLWNVLFPAKKVKLNTKFRLPGEATFELIEKGRPQKITTSKPLTQDYFLNFAELPLPPYIQQARGERHNREEDKIWYQTAWAKEYGSFAAPTASLHFSEADLLELEKKGTKVVKITLHVGLGTFLPITSVNLNDHKMHAEFIHISQSAKEAIDMTKSQGGQVWALGTTVARSLESLACGLLQFRGGYYSGHSDIFIKPGYVWKSVDRLLTNFHQPESTLLALVASFQNLQKVKNVYQFAIDNKFRLFSYGDLSVWEKE